MRRAIRQLVLPVAAIAFCLVLTIMARDYPLSSRRLPVLIGTITIGLALIQIWLETAKIKAAGKSDSVPSAPDTEGTDAAKRVLHVFLLMPATIILWSVLGYIVGSVLAATWVAVTLDRKHTVNSALVLAGACAVLYVVFHSILGVPLPQGVIGRALMGR
ncbi:MAG: tripartite tricarboxylate transporter TctB family protein [Firmicutes bacterium]|jgi:small-conductance mechanosensitive channel|nr:tripartite tricarboxylate transporter TctB family protein [Bacillota bacterium]